MTVTNTDLGTDYSGRSQILTSLENQDGQFSLEFQRIKYMPVLFSYFLTSVKELCQKTGISQVLLLDFRSLGLHFPALITLTEVIEFHPFP